MSKADISSLTSKNALWGAIWESLARCKYEEARNLKSAVTSKVVKSLWKEVYPFLHTQVRVLFVWNILPLVLSHMRENSKETCWKQTYLTTITKASLSFPISALPTNLHLQVASVPKQRHCAQTVTSIPTASNAALH